MEIILIRHGKAEEKREDLEDIKRHLTQKGKKEFSELAPKLKKKLKPLKDRQLVLWSSPANRATETADIVMDELKLSDPTLHDFIYSGEFEKFEKALEKVEEDVTLLVTGHEPTLTDWVKEMTGESIKLKKGAMVSLNVTDTSPIKAEIQWQINP